MTSLCPNDVTNGVIEMTPLMTSSGPIEKLHGGTSQRSTFLNLEEAELLCVRCTICLNSNRHLVIGPFQKSKFKPTVLPAGSLAPRQLAHHPVGEKSRMQKRDVSSAGHGDQVCEGDKPA